eukprot:gene35370-25004_t
MPAVFALRTDRRQPWVEWKWTLRSPPAPPPGCRCVSRSMADYDGDWGKAAIRGKVPTWADGGDTALTYTPSGFSMNFGGKTYTATLSAGKLVWSDGDVWERATSPANRTAVPQCVDDLAFADKGPEDLPITAGRGTATSPRFG